MNPVHCVNDNDMERRKSGTSLIGVYIKSKSDSVLPSISPSLSVVTLLTCQLLALFGKTIRFVCEPSTNILQLRWAIQDAEGIPPCQTLLVYAGKALIDPKSFEECGIRDGSIVHLILTLRGSKPAIYLLSPVALEVVKVSVTLSSDWR